MPRPRLKQHKLYLLYRIYCVGAIIAWNATALLWGLSQAATPRDTPNYLSEALPFLLMIPIILPALFMACNLAVFPFEFSVFGPYERTPFPNEVPILKQSWLGGRVSWFSGGAPIFTWVIYASGIGISILGIGKVFIPVDCIVELRPGLIGYTLRHNSPELRNPVTLPTYDLFEAVQGIMRRPHLNSVV